jgi:hypothetical protein
VHDSVTRSIPSPVGAAPGEIELDYVDGVVDLVPHAAPPHVPRGAPVVVRGWASQAAGIAPRGVRVLLDRTNAYDVRTARDAGARGELRFAATIPTAAITPGGHVVQAVVLCDDERWYETGRRTFTLYEPQLVAAPFSAPSARLHVEDVVDARPDKSRRVATDAVPLGHHAIVSGWAVDARSLEPATGVIVTVQGRRYSAGCSLARPDVRSALGVSGSDRIGFEVFVPASDLGRGDHVARVDSVDARGRVTASGTVLIRIASRSRLFPPFATCAPDAPAYEARVRIRPEHGAADDDDDDPVAPRDAMSPTTWRALHGETLEVSGWADDPWGSPATEVFLELVHTGDVTALAPHRLAGISGYAAGDPARGGAFRFVLPLRHERARALDLALLVLGADRRVYGRARLGTLRVSSDE